MYNHTKQSQEDLPSAARLLRSTLAALGIAVVILFTTVLPAEYAIDPTGIGAFLGFQDMGETKAQLAEEAAADKAAQQNPSGADEEVIERLERIEAALSRLEMAHASGASAQGSEASEQEKEAATDNVGEETMTFTLSPNQGAEIKVEMAEGARVDYSWSSEGGEINYDTHGNPYDSGSDFYHGYSKGTFVSGDQGELEAAFDGWHGWFWRNRTDEEVELTLTVKGDFKAMKRVL